MINIQSDSRKIKPGDIFVALRGIGRDGHTFIDKAISNGATKIIAEEGEYSVSTEIVADTREYLNEYLKENYNKYLDKMNIIGITGTNGKTTTAWLLHEFLNKIGKKTAYIGTIGFYIKEKICNLPNTTVDICDMYDLMMQAYDTGCENIVLEVSSHALAMGRIETIEFDYTIFTNLTQDHLDYHKTMGNYALAKQLLFKKLKTAGTAVVNTDDKYAEYFLLKENNNVTYGFKDADYAIKDYEMTSNGSTFTYIHEGQENKIETKLLGRYNVYNILAVITVLDKMGIPLSVIQKYIPLLTAPAGRMEFIEYNKGAIVIDYAHTPDAIEKVITTVKEVMKGKIYVVFGCTGDRDRLKRPMMTELVDHLSDYFIITNDDPHYEDPKQIVDDMTRDFVSDKYEICLDRETAIIKGIELLNAGDTLFILGKGHEEFMIIRDEKVPFNDKNVVINYLKEKSVA